MSDPNAKVGIGGAPTRATSIPTDAKARKTFPIASGFLDYFPDAVAAIANLSHVGNEQHNPGQPLHWARSKSGDEADTMMRHFLQRGTTDTDGVRHTVKVCWRALAMLQKEIEAEQGCQPAPPTPPVPHAPPPIHSPSEGEAPGEAIQGTSYDSKGAAGGAGAGLPL